MRLTHIVIAILLIATPLAALAPTASAKPYCTVGESDCRGYLVCVYKTDTCVPDPCFTTHCYFEPTAEAWDGCVQYAYIADYHWYYVCVAPKDTSCPVYFKERHGNTVYTQCVVELGAASEDVAIEATCIPTSGGMDYHSYLCIDASNPECLVYHESTSDWGTRRFCAPPSVAAEGAQTPLKDGDGDGDMELGPACVWGFSSGCVVPAYECFQPYRPAFGITCI